MQFRSSLCAAVLYALLCCCPKSLVAQELPGSLDRSFFIGNGPDGSVYSIAVQSDGKVLIGGVFNKYNGVTNRAFARINPNGSPDTTFTSPITDATAQGL